MGPTAIDWYPETDDLPAAFAGGSGWMDLDGPPARLSCLLPVRDGGQALIHCATNLADVLTDLGLPWEILVLDHDSRDGSFAWAREWARVPGYRLGRFPAPWSRRQVIHAGLHRARGDLVLLLDPTLTDALDLARRALALAMTGARLVLWADGLRDEPGMPPLRARLLPVAEPSPAQLSSLDPVQERVLLLDRQALHVHLRPRA